MLFIISAAMLLLYVYSVWPYSFWKKKGVRYDAGFAIFGSITKCLLGQEHMGNILLELYRKFENEPYFGIFTICTPTLVIKDPAIINEITVKQIDTFIEHKLFSTDDTEHAFNASLFHSSASVWKKVRPTVSPVFSGSKIKAMHALVQKCARNGQTVLKCNSFETIRIDVNDFCFRFSNDCISSCIFGLETDSYKDVDSEFFVNCHEISDFGKGSKVFALFGYCFKKFIVKLFDLRVIPMEEERYFSQVVLNTMAIRRKEGIIRSDVLNFLMKLQDNQESGLPLLDREIAGLSLQLLIAGADTTSIGMAFLFYELAMNKTIQDKLAEEIIETIQENDGKLNHEHLTNLKYLDMVCSESLRKWPPLPVTDRYTTKPYTFNVPNQKPLHLEKGSIVWLPILAIHRDSSYYKNPDEFNPERFSEQNRRHIRKETYLPFGNGPRMCIGLRLGLLMMKMIISTILRDFEIVVVKETPETIELKKRYVFLTSTHPIILGFKKRH